MISEAYTDLNLCRIQCGLVSPATSSDTPESFRLLLLNSRVFKQEVFEVKTEAKSAQQHPFSLHCLKLKKHQQIIPKINYRPRK